MFYVSFRMHTKTKLLLSTNSHVHNILEALYTFLVWEWTGKDDSYKAFTIPSSTLNISLINASVARYASSVEESQILNNLGNNELR